MNYVLRGDPTITNAAIRDGSIKVYAYPKFNLELSSRIGYVTGWTVCTLLILLFSSAECRAESMSHLITGSAVAMVSCALFVHRNAEKIRKESRLVATLLRPTTEGENVTENDGDITTTTDEN